MTTPHFRSRWTMKEIKVSLQEEIKEEKGEGTVVDIKGRGLSIVVFLVVVLCVVCRVVLLNI